jgi:hypothetical protein
MPLFISSSNRRRQALRELAFGAWVVAASVGCAILFAPAAARQMDIVTHRDPPPGGNFYLAHDRGGHVDHHVIYHGIDAVVKQRLRTADVLLLGNSRMMFALDPATTAEHFNRAGRSFYVLGFGHEEQDDFPLEIIRANDLRPSVVVINADHFFASERSEWAARVVEETDFDAWKIQVEGELAHRVRRVVHQWVPHYVDIRRGMREVVLYRSRENGTWFVANDFGVGTAFAWPDEEGWMPQPEQLQAAERFKRELDERGARLVLCVVPGPGVSLARARAIAEHLSVPLVVPDAGVLRTIDNSHLSRESAVRVAESLLAQLSAYW